MVLQSTTTTNEVDPAAVAVFGVVYLVLVLVFVLAVHVLTALPLHGTFAKAGRPDVPAWSAWIPVYDYYSLCKLVGRPGWWTLLLFAPPVSVVVSIVLHYDLSRSFGHGGGFTVGLVLLGPVFLFVLWLGPSRYLGPAALSPGQPRLG